MRLAACEEAAGQLTSAIGWAQKALMLHPRDADAYCVVGNLFLAAGELKKAEQHFKTVHSLEKCEADSYASLQLGWIQLLTARGANAPHEPLLQVACCRRRRHPHGRVAGV